MQLGDLLVPPRLTSSISQAQFPVLLMIPLYSYPSPSEVIYWFLPNKTRSKCFDMIKIVEFFFGYRNQDDGYEQVHQIHTVIDVFPLKW